MYNVSGQFAARTTKGGMKRVMVLIDKWRKKRRIRLPCKVGDRVYQVIDDCTFPVDCGTTNKCKGCEYRNLFIEEDVFHLNLLTDSGKLRRGYYTTREAAEKALEARKNG